MLGWNNQWNGMTDKVNGYLTFINKLHHDDIVVCIDAFDTLIVKNTSNLVNDFKTYHCDILLSKDEELYGHYLTSKVFGECRKNIVANAGMIMGYASKMSNLFTLLLREKSTDDQKNLNTICKYFTNLKIDTKYKIFKNNTSFRDDNKSAYFISYPCSIQIHGYKTWLQKMISLCKVHYKTFWFEICIYIFLFCILLYYITIQN